MILKRNVCRIAAVAVLALFIAVFAGCATPGNSNPTETVPASETAIVPTAENGNTSETAPGEETPEATGEESTPAQEEKTPESTEHDVTAETPEGSSEPTAAPEETAKPEETKTPEPTATPTPEIQSTPTPAPTSKQTPTPAPTITFTPAPTPTPVPTPIPFQSVIDPARLDMDTALQHNLTSYLTNVKYCSYEAGEDPEEGAVLVFKTKSITLPDTRTPSFFLDYSGFCKNAGKTPVSIGDRPYLVLKVKGEGLANSMLSLLGAATKYETETTRSEYFMPVANGAWQYVCFDLSRVEKPEELSMFRVNFEQYAAADGEIFKISEIMFLTKEEAQPYIKPDVYDIGETYQDKLELKVLQFNIQTENGNSTPFRARADMYRQLMDELQPDVVGMEEVTVNWLKWLDAFVFNDSYEGVGEARSKGGEANSIYYRKDKFELVESGTFWLSDTPDVVGSAFEKANYPRICTYVILRDRATGIVFAHMNTHLDHNGNNNSTDGNTVRKEQMKVLIRFWIKLEQKYGEIPMFLTGDMNNRRTTSEGKLYALYKMITGKSAVDDGNGGNYKMKLSDARLDAEKTVDEDHIATMVSNYDETGSSYNPAKEPIDYVFYSPARTKAESYETFLIKRGSFLISDHLPVFATFTISK